MFAALGGETPIICRNTSQEGMCADSWGRQEVIFTKPCVLVEAGVFGGFGGPKIAVGLQADLFFMVLNS